MRLWVDEGHGGNDSGAVGGGKVEDSRNLTLGNEIERLAKIQGWACDSTRDGDIAVALANRYTAANKYNADVFVSIHHDWTKGEQAVIYPNNHDITTSRRLADAVNVRIDPLAPTAGCIYADRRGLAVLKGTGMPAVVIEASRVQDSYDVKKMAVAIVRGICDYKGLAYKEAGSVSTETYRIVTVETASQVHRNRLVEMLVANGAAHAVLGRSITFHDALVDVKEIEDYIAKYPAEIKRTNGVLVARGTHIPLNLPLPNGQFTDAEAF